MTGLRIAVCVTLAAWASLCLGTASPASPPRYTITDLGTLGGDESYATGLNELGQVIGQSETTPGQTVAHAFLWTNGHMVDLGTLGGPYSWASGVNALGQVVGSSWTANSSDTHGFLWDQNGMIDLGTLDGRKGFSHAYGINDLGQIVGTTAATGDWFQRPFLWERGIMQDLGTGDAKGGVARAINNHGQIVGAAISADQNSRPALWDHGQFYLFPTSSSLPGKNGAVGINDAGQVIIQSFQPTRQFWWAQLWSQGRLQDLSPSAEVASEVDALSPAGQIVGWIHDPSEKVAHVALWEGGRVDEVDTLIPPDSGWTDLYLNGVNSAGQIAGRGVRNGKERAILITPAR
jgi:probable HAF family extracellular repeat protein